MPSKTKFAAVHGLQYLLTWNCTHIANATFRSRIEAICRAAEVEPPLICTPLELMPPEGGAVTDDILAEIRATREAFSVAHGHNIQAMCDTLDRIAVENGWKTVTLPPRPAVPPVLAAPPAAEPAPGDPRSTPASSA